MHYSPISWCARRGKKKDRMEKEGQKKRFQEMDGRRDRLGPGVSPYGPYSGRPFNPPKERYVAPVAGCPHSPKCTNYPLCMATRKKVVKVMSAPIWCDIDDPQTNAIGQIGHPFSAKDTGKQHYTKQNEKKNRYDETVIEQEDIDICGYHANGLFQPKKTPATITPPTPEMAN
jgi:hypothetical protein